MRNVLALFFVCCVALSASAKKIEGYYIARTFDTIKVVFSIPGNIVTGEPDFEKLQWEIEYWDNQEKKQILKPNMAVEVDFIYKEKNYRMIAKVNNIGLIGSKENGTNYLFLKVLVDGPLQLFQYYVVSNAPGYYSSASSMSTVSSSPTTNDKFILCKQDGKLFRPKMLSFAKEVSAYLSDNVALSQKVETKKLESKDMEQIVLEYNAALK